MADVKDYESAIEAPDAGRKTQKLKTAERGTSQLSHYEDDLSAHAGESAS